MDRLNFNLTERQCNTCQTKWVGDGRCPLCTGPVASRLFILHGLEVKLRPEVEAVIINALHPFQGMPSTDRTNARAKEAMDRAVNDFLRRP